MEGQAERKKKTETRKGITISTKINNQGKERKGANARMKTWTRNKEKRRSDNDLQLFAFFPNGHIDGWRQRKSLKRHLDGVACWHHCHLWYRQLGCTQESLFIISIRKCFFLARFTGSRGLFKVSLTYLKILKFKWTFLHIYSLSDILKPRPLSFL